MTAEEPFERIEHVTAALAEERRKDREEYKALWRDQQRQVWELTAGLAELRRHVDDLAVETRLRFEQVGEQIQQLAAENRATNQRIDALVSGDRPAHRNAKALVRRRDNHHLHILGKRDNAMHQTARP
jgi:hypothetical protein